ncbi:class I SAM-dependent methyltransferase [Paenibacillus gorillae]|uniref:class I SAM-dependent methyltransferase n=1 Tax=Paenibacillus gorillae TaxID=1243662 RepID=UPI0004ACE7A5|nr:class I SAM-dependent methyltransferase [Paenibacillus gorillae]
MNKVIDYYSIFDEWGRLDREPLEFIINLHYMMKYMPPAGKVLDNGAGPGKYALELAKRGHNVTLTDLTPKMVETARQKAEEFGLLPQFEGFHIRNAISLEGLPDESYEASLMLGPLYHLQLEQDRVAAVKELHRVTKSGGIVFAAVQTRMRMAINSLQSPRNWKPNDRMASIRQFYDNGLFDHADQGRFTGAYYFGVEELQPLMESQGFETIDIISSSSIGNLLNEEQKQYWADQGEYESFIEFLISAANDPSIRGVTSHLLYIGKRI